MYKTKLKSDYSRKELLSGPKKTILKELSNYNLKGIVGRISIAIAQHIENKKMKETHNNNLYILTYNILTFFKD